MFNLFYNIIISILVLRVSTKISLLLDPINLLQRSFIVFIQ